MTTAIVGVCSFSYEILQTNDFVNETTIAMLKPNKSLRTVFLFFFYLNRMCFSLSTARSCILSDSVSLSVAVLVSELEKKYYNDKFVNESLL